MNNEYYNPETDDKFPENSKIAIAIIVLILFALYLFN